MTDDNIISLGEVRAHQKDDAREWTPLEALKALVRRIDAGEVNPTALVTWFWDKQGDKEYLRYVAAGLTKEQLVALMAMAQQRALEEWRGDVNCQ